MVSKRSHMKILYSLKTRSFLSPSIFPRHGKNANHANHVSHVTNVVLIEYYDLVYRDLRKYLHLILDKEVLFPDLCNLFIILGIRLG